MPCFCVLLPVVPPHLPHNLPQPKAKCFALSSPPKPLWAGASSTPPSGARRPGAEAGSPPHGAVRRPCAVIAPGATARGCRQRVGIPWSHALGGRREAGRVSSHENRPERRSRHRCCRVCSAGKNGSLLVPRLRGAPSSESIMTTPNFWERAVSAVPVTGSA